jgi:hypothetical protein
MAIRSEGRFLSRVYTAVGCSNASAAKRRARYTASSDDTERDLSQVLRQGFRSIAPPPGFPPARNVSQWYFLLLIRRTCCAPVVCH